ncbi:copper amine oxidase [Halobacillus litoralis]|uniref:copper amine oxidase n=1 Tax=Halobacillus litoralis TaxID=45668 RepID=UPI001CFF4658|nr:copper amine oxidase [Halobacillus litoralis]
MNWKKTFVALPLSAALVIPTASPAFADDHGNHTNMDKVTVSTPAADLRATLDQYLSEHAYLAVVTMQKGVQGAEDFEEAAGALEANTQDLTGAIASVYGEEAGKQFNDMWSEHIGYFVDYVKATAEDNEEGRQEALNNLDNYRADFSQFLETATDERLEASALAEGLQMHVNQLIGAFDNYEEGNFDEAYEKLRMSIDHMYGVGKGLSTAITNQFPDKFENTSPATPAADLRADLNHLLSEHAALAVLAMQKGGDGAEDFEEAAGALNNNTEDLTAAIASVYGEEAGEQFNEMWSEHIGFFVDYVQASVNEDDQAKEQALTALDGYRKDFSEFLDTATEGGLEAENTAEGLQMHVNQLTGAFDNYIEGDFDMAYEEVRKAYAHMYGVGEGLSGAIVNQNPEMFASDMPTEMPKTGMGGMSEEGGLNAWMIAFASMAAALAAVVVGVRRKNNQA